MNMKRIKSDRILLSDSLFNGYVYMEGDKITEVSKEEHPVTEEYDATGHYVSAGFIDIHTHGGGGFRFEGEADEIVAGANFHLRHGTTTICPTVSAAPLSEMALSAEHIRLASRDSRLEGTIVGAHLEGPYLSRKQAGAQCADFIGAPKKEEYLPFLDKQASDVCRVTYAPEQDTDGAFLAALRAHGIVVSAGHTDATYGELFPAVEGGCQLITHLYSCTSTVTREYGFRRLGVIETAFLLDDLFVEIICDGKHLPPELIKLIYKIKGREKIALITDSLALAGTSQTEGVMQATEYIIEDGVCKLKDRSAFAGSIATADRLVRVAVKEAGIPLVDAVYMLTAVPARIMGLAHKGHLRAGCDADVVVFDEDINIIDVFSKGKKIGAV